MTGDRIVVAGVVRDLAIPAVSHRTTLWCRWLRLGVLGWDVPSVGADMTSSFRR